MTDAMEKDIQEWVSLGTRIPRNRVIPANSKYPNPYESETGSDKGDPYATVLVVNEQAILQSRGDYETGPGTAYGEPPEQGHTVLTQAREALVQVSIFRAEDREFDLFTYVDGEPGKTKAIQLGFKVLRLVTRTLARDTPRRDEWEMGMVVDLTIGYTVTWTEGFPYPTLPSILPEFDRG